MWFSVLQISKIKVTISSCCACHWSANEVPAHGPDSRHRHCKALLQITKLMVMKENKLFTWCEGQESDEGKYRRYEIWSQCLASMEARRPLSLLSPSTMSLRRRISFSGRKEHLLVICLFLSGLEGRHLAASELGGSLVCLVWFTVSATMYFCLKEIPAILLNINQPS